MPAMDPESDFSADPAKVPKLPKIDPLASPAPGSQTRRTVTEERYEPMWRQPQKKSRRV